MDRIRLVQDGIFPITKKANAENTSNSPETGFSIPGTIQGEGKLTGIPVLFIRTAGCNLRCAWKTSAGGISICDTPYSSFDVRNSRYIDIDEIVKTIELNAGNIKHIVVSGGEPMMQKDGLIKLCKSLKASGGYHITIESNGTFFHEELNNYVDLFSLSPKLRSSVPDIDKIQNTNFPVAENYQLLHEKRRINIPVLQNLINTRKIHGIDFQLKFVWSCKDDSREIRQILKQLEGWNPDDILLMPLGKDRNELKLSEGEALIECLQNGWRFNQRLHIDLFGDKHGV